ncbi:hypothetical protein ACVIDN_007438 [Rhizobium brockwellii]
MSRKAEGERADIYARITDRIVADLEKGVKPWMKPWHAPNTNGRITRPLRHNGQPYSGMNILLLWSEGMARGFTSPMWMTFKQALELGAAVRKGETGSTVVFASRFTKSEADGNGGEIDREIPFLKAYKASTSSRSMGCRNTAITYRVQRSNLASASSAPIAFSRTRALSFGMVARRRITRRSRITSRCRRSRRFAMPPLTWQR